MFNEFFEGISNLTNLEIISDIHGGLAMLAIFLFGASLFCFFALDKFAKAANWFRICLIILLTDLILLDCFGLFIYAPYRAKGGARDTLLASSSTAWLHQIIFEHKEFLAFGPIILISVATIIAYYAPDQLKKDKYLKLAVFFSIVAALIMVATVAAEAVLVTKVAPIK